MEEKSGVNKVLEIDTASADVLRTPAAASSVFSAKLKQYNYVSDTDQNLVRRSTRVTRRGIVDDIANPVRSTTVSSQRVKRPGSVDGLSPPSGAKKQRRSSSKYAAPSRYAHLAPLVDILEPNLICVFVGVNPGIM